MTQFHRGHLGLLFFPFIKKQPPTNQNLTLLHILHIIYWSGHSTTKIWIKLGGGVVKKNVKKQTNKKTITTKWIVTTQNTEIPFPVSILRSFHPWNWFFLTRQRRNAWISLNIITLPRAHHSTTDTISNSNWKLQENDTFKKDYTLLRPVLIYEMPTTFQV